MASSETNVWRQRKVLSLNSMQFNRYLLLRYVTAGFFFVNLYWLVLMSPTTSWVKWLPFSLVLVHGAIAIEQASKYWHHQHDLPVTKWGYFFQSMTNVGLLIGLGLGASHQVVPFFSTRGSQLTMIGVGIGLLLALLVERRTWLIEHDLDAYYARLTAFKASLN
ncbi:PTS cellobiose transporter subunit IIC [Latilactobacillus curvatus]|uniref:PTS cellobiose transporter subunit IIC n=1 Tax=Latilactobacillus curvatus TaxID=28038 RepID=UPI00223BEF97|nr:PTS cellobiose transporter subunit IIC [Latilactobacillus curvatus]MCS8617781.1 PTS cellobiose transporter subunit IIC [Latilactobacillus curvatus]